MDCTIVASRAVARRAVVFAVLAFAVGCSASQARVDQFLSSSTTSLHRAQRPVRRTRVGRAVSALRARGDAAALEDGWDWIDGRQTEFYLIR
jgi:hypothetical protein